MGNKSKEIGYAIVGIGAGLLGYYIIKRTTQKNIASSTTSTSKPSTTTQNTTPNTAVTNNQTSVPTSSSQCNLITPNNYSQQLLADCFGGSLTQCGFYQPLISQNGFCEAFQTGLNASITPPNIKSGLIFYNATDGFFGLYWAYPGTYGGVSPCYCSGSSQELPYNQTGAFFDWIGLILPGYYTWLPVYEFPSTGIGFLTYKGVLWYSPITYGTLGYIKNNNITYTIKLEDTPDSLGYSIQHYTTDVGGSLCFNYPDFNSAFCLSIAPNQTVPFWASNTTTVRWCPSTTPNNCTVVYG